MRKEVLTSILVGLFLGLIITYGFYTAKLSTQTADVTKKLDIELAPTSIPDENGAQKLQLTSPEDELITTETKVLVAGQTDPNSFVVISLLEVVQIINSDEAGKFSLELPLKPGGNIIEVKTIDENGLVSTATRNVVYDDGIIAIASGSAVVAKTPTPSAKPSTRPTLRPTLRPTSSP
jgi:hypothetical protein